MDIKRDLRSSMASKRAQRGTSAKKIRMEKYYNKYD